MNDIELESIGKLTSHPDVPDEWLISQPISISFFDGKELKVTLDGDFENDESFLSDVDKTIQNFISKDSKNRLSLSKIVYKNYKQTQDYYDSLPYYVAPLELNNETEIWKYVRPNEIYVCRGFEEDRNMYLQVHCSCDWEEEHGLQLVFKNGLDLTKVSGIDYNPTQ